MGMLDPFLLGLTLSVLAVNGIAVVVIVPRIRRAMERSQREVGGMAAALERSLGAIRTVKASGAEKREIWTVRRTARRAWQRGVEAARWTAVMDASAGLAVQASFLAVLGVSAARVPSGQLPVCSLIAFLLYVVLLSEPLTALVTGISQLQAGLAAVLRDQRDPRPAHGRPRQRAESRSRTVPTSVHRVLACVVPLPRRRRPAMGPAGPHVQRAARGRNRDRRTVGHRQDDALRAARALLCHNAAASASTVATCAAGRCPSCAQCSATSNRTRRPSPARSATTSASPRRMHPPPRSTPWCDSHGSTG